MLRRLPLAWHSIAWHFAECVLEAWSTVSGPYYELVPVHKEKDKQKPSRRMTIDNMTWQDEVDFPGSFG